MLFYQLKIFAVTQKVCLPRGSELRLSLNIRIVSSASLAKKAKYFFSAHNCLWRVIKSRFYLAYNLTEIPQGHFLTCVQQNVTCPCFETFLVTVLSHCLSHFPPQLLKMGMLTTTQNRYSAGWASLPLLNKRQHSTQNNLPFTMHLRINLF